MEDSGKTLMSAYDSRHLMRIKAGDPHQYTNLSLLTHGLSESPKSQRSAVCPYGTWRVTEGPYCPSGVRGSRQMHGFRGGFIWSPTFFLYLPSVIIMYPFLHPSIFIHPSSSRAELIPGPVWFNVGPVTEPRRPKSKPVSWKSDRARDVHVARCFTAASTDSLSEINVCKIGAKLPGPRDGQR
jgi:hypothetical protein